MKIVSYILSLIFVVVFFTILFIFHPLQWLGLKISQNTHQKVVDIMNLFIVRSLLILGVTTRFTNNQKLPENKTLVFVSNHQSMFDIPPIGWYLRKHFAKFVSKKELGKGIPSISFNLRNGGSCLIDRKDRGSAIKVLLDFSKRLNKNNWSAAIFAEGTRTKDGSTKAFSFGGIKTILSKNPDALIVPITINNGWKVFKYGKFPLGVFIPVTFEVHEAMSFNQDNLDEVLKEVEKKVNSTLIV